MTDKQEDSLTKLNTQWNKSMVLMDTTVEHETPQPRSTKTIKINTKIQPPSPANASPGASRRSILKKTDKILSKQRDNTETQEAGTEDELNVTRHCGLSTVHMPTARAHNLEQLIEEEALAIESKNSTFNLDDLSDSEDVWIMDIPGTVDPQELKGQTLLLGEKSKLKINEERYCAVSHDVKYNVTCVFSTGNATPRYKTVNIKPAGAITVRRKLTGIPKIKPIKVENCGVPFPQNLKMRHPLFGVSHEGKVRK